MGECRRSRSWRFLPCRPRSTSGCVARASRVDLRAPRLEVPSPGLPWRVQAYLALIHAQSNLSWHAVQIVVRRRGKSPAIAIGRVQAIMASYICHASANSQVEREDSLFRHDAAGALLHAPRAAQARLRAASNSRCAINAALVLRMRGEDPRRMNRLKPSSALAVLCVNQLNRRGDARNERNEQQLFPRRVRGCANV